MHADGGTGGFLAALEEDERRRAPGGNAPAGRPVARDAERYKQRVARAKRCVNEK